jgi:bifunctional non-homologous end joining protein LigD
VGRRRTGKSAPAFVAPQLATLVDAVPDGEDWLNEIKYDGYRLIAIKSDGQVRLVTRNGNDWTERFPDVADGLARVPAATAVLDGEVVVFEGSGRTSFQMLQARLEAGAGHPLSYVAFDLLHLDGEDVRAQPLTERRAMLDALIRRARGKGKPQMSAELPGSSDVLLAAACRLGLEGLISKRRDAPYVSGRSRSWLKIKCGMRQEFVVVGYTPPKGSRVAIGALLLGVLEPRGRIRYAGRVGTGMPDALLRSLGRRLSPLRRDSSPLAPLPHGLPAGVQWVEPIVVVEVAFAEWTTESRLRHPSLIAVRDDKPARQVKRERVKATSAVENAMPEVSGVVISNPGRVVYPGVGLTKLDAARFIERVAPRMLPHVAGRPLTFLRCPEGIADECFFQKHWTGQVPDTLDTIPIRQGGGEVRRYVVVHDVPGLVTLVQWGILEIHLWGARSDDVERPDRVTFDLDPGDGVEWKDMRSAARAVRTLLQSAGLESWLKTSGGKGLHVVVPLARRSTWDETSEFARAVAERLADEAPSRFVSVASKAKRPGKVFVDWLRNTRGSTSVAPWSMRARPGAGVSVPIPWGALGRVKAGDQYTVQTLSRGKLPADAWSDIDQVRQQLSKRVLAQIRG